MFRGTGRSTDVSGAQPAISLEPGDGRTIVRNRRRLALSQFRNMNNQPASRLVLFCFVASSLLLGCDRPPNLAPLDLMAAGLDGSVDAPVGAVASKSAFGSSVVIEAPEGYVATIQPWKLDIASAKAGCERASQKNCTVVVDQPDVMIAKWRQLSKDNFAVHVAVTAAGGTFSCESEPLRARLKSKALAESMVQTCKSLSLRTLPSPVATKEAKPAPVVLTGATLPSLAPLALSSSGFPRHVSAPAGAVPKVGFGGVLNIKAGDGFQLEVRKGPVDLVKRRTEIKGNNLNKLKRFLVDSPEVLIYETEVVIPEFHFVANVKVGSQLYYCEDNKSLFRQSDVELMLKACQSLAP